MAAIRNTVLWLPRQMWRLLRQLRRWLLKHWLKLILFIIIPVAVLVLVWAIRWAYLQSPIDWEWTGFGEFLQPGDEDFERGKTLWDWMSLILVPLTLFGIATLFNQQVRTREQRREAHEEALEKQARQERNREDALQAYFNEMATLIIEHGLLTDNLHYKTPAWQVAQLRTVTILRRMTDDNGTDTSRIDEILTFLRDSSLLIGDQGLLTRATMTGIVLTGNLERANLEGAYMKGANLRKANLWGANLKRVVAWNADFSEANLFLADLTAATLVEVNLERANLERANLQGANLAGANLCETTLWEAIFNTETVLPDAHYSHDTQQYLSIYSMWHSEANLDRYIDPHHPDFWRSKVRSSPAYRSNDSK